MTIRISDIVVLLVIREITRVVISQINRVQYENGNANIYMPETNVDVAFRLSNSL